MKEGDDAVEWNIGAAVEGVKVAYKGFTKIWNYIQGVFIANREYWVDMHGKLTAFYFETCRSSSAESQLYRGLSIDLEKYSEDIRCLMHSNSVGIKVASSLTAWSKEEPLINIPIKIKAIRKLKRLRFFWKTAIKIFLPIKGEDGDSKCLYISNNEHDLHYLYTGNYQVCFTNGAVLYAAVTEEDGSKNIDRLLTEAGYRIYEAVIRVDADTYYEYIIEDFKKMDIKKPKFQ